ncbi:MAG: hypothetical protein M3O46_11810 [Myxococcota bacterium]|nr:hypothetical protein [Myxococcota bacterium]
MTSQDHDTDPSTPGAKRRSDSRAPVGVALDDVVRSSDEDTSSTLDEVAALAAQAPSSLDEDEEKDGGVPPTPPRAGEMQRLSRPTTDPGIAPPPESLVAPAQSMRVVVPSVIPKPVDSVDVLLDGIGDDSSQRRTKPERDGRQSDGRPAMKYHGERTGAARGMSTDDERKVMIARRPLSQTGRSAAGNVSQREGDRDARDETTAVEVHVLAGRVFVAVLAGLIVVTVIFISLRRSSNGLPDATRTSVIKSEPVSPSPHAAAQNVAPAPVPADTGDSTRPPETSAEAQTVVSSVAVARSASPTAAPAPKPARPKVKPSASAARSASPPLGEFKTSF